ncbi:MAG TPA: diaminobutyrate--2-oxoglutarate transaminase [Acidimicrobiales bacterium]
MSTIERHESQVRSYCRTWPTTFATASGAVLTDVEGREFIDFFAGAGTLNYGHNHPALKTRLVEYLLDDGVTHSLDTMTEAKVRFLERFVEVVLEPRGLDHKVMFPGPTGTNAVEAALKLARKVTGRHNVVSFTNAFHGMTLGSLAITGNAMKRGGAGVSLDGAVSMPFDGFLDSDIDSLHVLESYLDDAGSGLDPPAAVIVETIQGEGGVNVARPSWLRGLADLCAKHDVLLIVDDIQVGCGRTGTFLSFDDIGIEPDIICLSKSLSGYGLPFAVVTFRSDLDVWEPGEHNGTFRGSCPAMVTATAALDLWADGDLGRSVRRKGARIEARLSDMADRHSDLIHEVRGRGMIHGVATRNGSIADRIVSECFERRLMVETSGADGEVVKLLPPLNIDVELLDEGIDRLSNAIDTVAASHDLTSTGGASR